MSGSSRLEIESEESNFTVEDLGAENTVQTITSLFPGNGGNDLSASHSSDTEAEPDAGNDAQPLCQVQSTSSSQNLIEDETWQAAIEEAERMAKLQACPYSPQQLERMQRYLNSGDPTLVAEARAWVRQLMQGRSRESGCDRSTSVRNDVAVDAEPYKASGRESESINSSADSPS